MAASDFLMPVDTNIKLDSVILSPENREKVNLLITETRNREKFLRYGLYPVNRVLMYGASGTGKTYLTKALSNELNLTLLYVDIAKALSDNSVAMNISEIFKLAHDKKNCIIFLDECDSITMSRYNASYDDNANVRRATNSLFQQLDQMDPRTVFVAATNLLFKIDPAFERRMNLKMEFKRPDMNIRDVVKKFLNSNFHIVDDLNKDVENIVSRRAAQNTKLSYYELQGIVERAMKRSILRNTTEVRLSEIYDDLQKSIGCKIRFGTDKDPDEMFKHPDDSWD